MKFILGQKIGMTQTFAANGTVQPVTRVDIAPCVITQVKTKEKDGYTALQVGTVEKKNLSKALRNHLKGLPHVTEKKGFRFIKELRMPSIDRMERGMEIALETFSTGDKVQVTGTSKGKGFAGVVKRHGFHGHPTTHGHKDQERMPGSIGAGGVQHVLKGKRMGGRMGFDRVTVKNLEIVSIDSEAGIVLVKGSIPGAPRSLVVIQGEGELVMKKPSEATKEQVRESSTLSEQETPSVSVDTPQPEAPQTEQA